MSVDNLPQLGGSPSIVEAFRIEGLYGYRTISLTSKYAATILIAKNGSGKTTLIGVLDAFLTRQFSRLTGLKFSRIVCKLRGCDTELVLTSEDIATLGQGVLRAEVVNQAARFGLDPVALVDFIDNDFPVLRKRPGDLTDNPVFEKILQKSTYSMVDALKQCDRIVGFLTGRNENIDNVSMIIGQVLQDIDIVYLPTYRRIELPLSPDPEEPSRSYGRKKSIHSKLGLSRRSLFSPDIQFGLSDISEKLGSLNQEILYKSNQGYRETSANIINELISGVFDNNTPSAHIRPQKAALALFFSRLQDRRSHMQFNDVVAIPDIDKIYGGVTDIPSESNKFLTYYLSKLNTVIEATKDIERVVEEFINNCNRYLAARDDSTVAPSNNVDDLEPYLDGKILTLDRQNLRVNVKSLATDKPISLDALSSGEKQMISLFARLYLYSGKKIILVDEPELSLSLDWQRRILLDVLRAPNCEQVIAITHSPFVFDNELEPFAKSLSLSLDVSAMQREAVEEAGAADE